MRTYKDKTTDEELFVRTVQRLGQFRVNKNDLTATLEDICRHVYFGCAFIYEINSQEVFCLKEFFSLFPANNKLIKEYKLSDHFSEESCQHMHSESLYFCNAHHDDRFKPLADLLNVQSMIVVPVIDMDDNFIGFVGLADRRQDIVLDENGINTAQKVLQLIANHVILRVYRERLEFSHNTLHIILNKMGIGLLVNDMCSSEILFVNDAIAKPYGGAQKLLGKRIPEIEEVQARMDIEALTKEKDPSKGEEEIIVSEFQRDVDGVWIRRFSSVFPWINGKQAKITSCIDISENKRHEKIIRHMAEYDELTGLPNRRKFFQDCDALLRNAKIQKQRLYLVFFDIDDFKKTNDTLGHLAGDTFLSKFAKKLQGNPLTKDVCYRYGGDEFILLMLDQPGIDIHDTIKDIQNIFSTPIQIGEKEVICKVSAGPAVFPEDAITPKGLLDVADARMYEIKQKKAETFGKISSVKQADLLVDA